MQQAYLASLTGSSRSRYLEKTTLIGGIDPYTIKKSDFISDVQLLPSISYPDIVNYLIHTPSSYTLDELKAYKSCEAYNYFVSGWVREVTTKLFDELPQCSVINLSLTRPPQP